MQYLNVKYQQTYHKKTLKMLFTHNKLLFKSGSWKKHTVQAGHMMLCANIFFFDCQKGKNKIHVVLRKKKIASDFFHGHWNPSKKSVFAAWPARGKNFFPLRFFMPRHLLVQFFASTFANGLIARKIFVPPPQR